jgi:two-component system cell cycle response regulator
MTMRTWPRREFFVLVRVSGNLRLLTWKLNVVSFSTSFPPLSTAKKILLIDDDPAIAELLRQLVSAFRRGPFVLEHVSDYEAGQQGLLTGDYALCLLDYHLADRDGLELLREMKASQCATPIIVLTGSTQEGTDMAAMDCGAADFISKAELTLRGLERAVAYALEMAATVSQLRDAASHDELTGVTNRREFDRRLREEWERCTRFHHPLALVMLDLDHFKPINDTHGHPMGDDVLRHLTRILKSRMRQVDCLARYGGDEFALIMVETNRAGALAAVTALCELLRTSPYRAPERQITLGLELSVGVAAYPEDATTLPALIAAADAALYTAKKQGRNRVRTAGDLP